MHQFSFPAVRSKQICKVALVRWRKDCSQKLMRDLADSLLCLPSVQLLGTTVPIGYYVIHIANEDGVMCKVEKSGLLAQHLLCRQVFQS